MNIKISPGAHHKLGQTLSDWVRAGLGEKGNAPTGWWREVERFYRNELPESPGKNIVPIHLPISQPRQDALTAQVCTVIGRQDPQMLCDLQNSDLADRRQRFAQKAWEDAGIRSQLPKASTDATNVNRGFFKITPRPKVKEGETSGSPATYGMQKSPGVTRCPGVEIAVIKPNDMVVFPAVLGGCQEAILSGNRFWKTIGECKRLMRTEAYYKLAIEPSEGDPAAADDTGGKARSGSLLNLSPDNDTKAGELFDCVVTYDLSLIDDSLPEGVKRYHVVLAIATSELMLLEDYPAEYRYVWYFETFYIPDGENYWPAMSVARNLKPLQDEYNKLHSTFYTYAMAAAKPPIIGPKLDGEGYTQWSYGDYLETEDPPQAWSPSITFQGQPLVVQMQAIERIADQVARVSQNTMGSVQNRDTTATTDSIVAAGVAVGIEDYIANFATPLPAMMEHTEDVLQGMWEDILPYYTREVQGPDGETTYQPLIELGELKIPTNWRVNGVSPSSTPTSKLHAATDMAQLAADPEFGIDKYALGTAIAKNSPLSGMSNIQIPKQELAKQMQARMEAEMAAKSPAPRLDEIIDSKMAEMMTPMEFGEFLQKIGITPDPMRAGMTSHPGGESGSAGPTAGPGPGIPGAGNAALLGPAAAPEPGQIPAAPPPGNA